MEVLETIPAKTILSGYHDPSLWFGSCYHMNLYKGCSHGCIYCDSRSDCYRIEEFDRVRAKADALTLLEHDLRSRRKSGVVESGSMSDPYRPLEAKACLTRGALKLLDRYHYGISITTKSSLAKRDMDLLLRIQMHSPVIIKITVTASEDSLSRVLEPRVCPSGERLDTLRSFSEAGLFCGVMMTPLLPFLEDTEGNVRSIVKKAADAGARFVYPSFGVTLRANQRDYFFDRLEESFPGLKQRYLSQFGDSYECLSPHTPQLREVFREECRKAGLKWKMADIIEDYQKEYRLEQLSLF